MRKRKSFEFVTKEASDCRGFSARDTLHFHYFNPNGVYAKQKELDDKIQGMVKSGRVKPGWHLAHGTLSHSFSQEKAQRLLNKKKPRRPEVDSWVRHMIWENENTQQAITKEMNR